MYLSIACAHRKEVIYVLGISIIVQIFEHFTDEITQKFHHVLTHLYPVYTWHFINSASDIINNHQRADSASQYFWASSTHTAGLYQYFLDL